MPALPDQAEREVMMETLTDRWNEFKRRADGDGNPASPADLAMFRLGANSLLLTLARNNQIPLDMVTVIDVYANEINEMGA